MMPDYRRTPYVAWPAWFYGPNGEAQIFERSEDVPEGWLDDPRKQADAKAPPPPQAESKPPLKRDEIVAELRRHNVLFQRNASTTSLYEKLLEVVEQDDA